MEYAARLRADARRADERRLLVLAGDGDGVCALARRALTAADVDPKETISVGEADGLPGRSIEQSATDRLLGTTWDAIVLDCRETCRPNAIGRAVGAVDGGGLLVLLTPPLEDWPERRDEFDATLAVPPFDRSDVTGHFRRRLVRTMRQHRGVAIVDADTETVERDGVIDAAPRLPQSKPDPPETHRFPAAAYDACHSQDQADAVAAFEGLFGDGALAIESDRGRGKSSAAGLAAASLALDGRDVLITAPNYRNCAEAFARAEELLTELDALESEAVEPRRLETEDGAVRFCPAIEAAEHPNGPDCVVVDEAAALPVSVLDRFLAADSVAFATTIHGYEGAGRGFAVRFRSHLEESRHDVTDCRLSEPIRYAPCDPIEVWAFRALRLDASPAVDPLVADATTETVGYRRLTAEDLLADESLLREVFGLLVFAHYRTEPDDLARLLDAPNVTVRALAHDDHVVSVALLAREGGLSAEQRRRMYEGERVRGNMIPDVLTSQLRDEDAAAPTGHRVLRIATHHAVRSRGLGSRLLDEIRAELDESDWLGVGYGATPQLVDFWRSNGFGVVHLSTTRNETSGEHSLIMLDPLTPAGESLYRRHAAWFAERIGPALADPLEDVDVDVVRETLAAIDAGIDPNLSEREWHVAAGYPSGVAVHGTHPRPARRLALCHLAGGTDDALSDRDERLLVSKALQGRPWNAVADELGFNSTADCMRAFSAALTPLVETLGDESVRAELDRFR